MTRLRTLVLAATALCGTSAADAAAPTAFPAVGFVAPWQLRLQGAAPAGTEPRFTPAPVPDQDVQPPLLRAERGGVFTPEVFGGRLPQTFHGDGYTPGSMMQSDQQRKLRLQQLAPGVNFSVPLQ